MPPMLATLSLQCTKIPWANYDFRDYTIHPQVVKHMLNWFLQLSEHLPKFHLSQNEPSSGNLLSADQHGSSPSSIASIKPSSAPSSLVSPTPSSHRTNWWVLFLHVRPAIKVPNHL